MTNAEQSPPDTPKPPLNSHSVGEALRDFWATYHWPTKVALLLLVSSCVLSAVFAGSPGIEDGANPALRVFASGAFQTIVTLMIALFIAINFQIRARRGLLDGDEHYNVARALAFGYFRNFLVPALQLAGRQGGEMQIFRPQTMADLQTYTRTLEPRIRQQFDHDWMPLVDAPKPGGPPRRTVLVVRRPLTTQAPTTTPDTAEAPFYFDAPTALFTVPDFYLALNRRREQEGKELLTDPTLLRYQNGQIYSFFQHLEFLFSTEAWSEAVGDIVASKEELDALHNDVHYVTIDELNRRYPATP
ncbi:MAG TPA: hypothetical protein VIT20_09440 [Propionibacteriaceae bacterium]